MRGRKPKPTHLKLILGNPGRRPLNTNEPTPRLAMPTVPPHLSDAAKVEWGHVVNEMYDAGIVTRLDRAMLAAYCQSYADWCEASELTQKYGSFAKGSKGQPVLSPFLKARDKARDAMVRYAAELGITPSARSRVSAVPPKDTKDPARKYF